MWIYIRVLDLIQLILLSGCMPILCNFYSFNSVVELEAWDGDTSSSSFVQNYFSYPEFFIFPYGVEYYSAKAYKELCWDAWNTITWEVEQKGSGTHGHL